MSSNLDNQEFLKTPGRLKNKEGCKTSDVS